jgi:protein-S-isoprenylcysteine O-methyltransferase Ste14
LFFIMAVQLTVIGVIPWLLAGVGPRLPMGVWRLIGIAPLAIDGLALPWCNWLFVEQGHGTAAPYDPPRVLAAHGPYRHVRNPMYVSAVLVVLGAAVWTGAASLFGYTVLLALGYHLFVRYYEEPRLQRGFGSAYADYCAGVPRSGGRGQFRGLAGDRRPPPPDGRMQGTADGLRGDIARDGRGKQGSGP